MDLDKNMRSADSNVKLDLEDERDKRARVNVLLYFFCGNNILILLPLAVKVLAGLHTLVFGH
jgi:hypothetical protein